MDNEALQNPFHVLLPELLGLIRAMLTTRHDVSSRVALQRTCKAAHALDKGLILASVWQTIYDDDVEKTTARPVIAFDARTQDHFLKMIREIHQTNLFARPWFPSEFTVRHMEDQYSQANNHNMCINLYWGLPLHRGYLLIDIIHTPEWDTRPERWYLHGDGKSDSDLEVGATTLDGLLDKCPTLGCGVHIDLLQAHYDDDDLEALFVKRAHRKW